MPIQQIGPASTPQLYFENQFKLSQQQISQRYESLQRQYRSQQIDYETAAKEIADMQAEADEQTKAFQSGMQLMQQSQKFVDLGIISPEENQEAMWAQVLPRELHQKMYPKQTAGSQREPFSPTEMVKYKDTVEYFGERNKPTKKKFGVDRWAKDVHTKKSLLKQYDTWKVNIGYNAMKSYEQDQVDNEWDNWAVDEGYDTGKPKTDVWNPGSKEIIAARGKGPLTKDYGAPARGTPTGPREAADPIANSIAASLPKKAKPKPEPQPRIWARNPKTKKRLYSDDGGKTWQAE